MTFALALILLFKIATGLLMTTSLTLLSNTKNVHHFPATSCATYTTAGLNILEHQSTSELYEILPNYLFRNDVDVIWRTTNSGEPPIHIEKFQKSEAIREKCQGDGCHYDEVLLTGLKEIILQSSKNKPN